MLPAGAPGNPPGVKTMTGKSKKKGRQKTTLQRVAAKGKLLSGGNPQSVSSDDDAWHAVLWSKGSMSAVSKVLVFGLSRSAYENSP